MGKKYLILIADDKDENRLLLRKIIASAGYDVQEAANGEEGLKIARLHKPDFIISDVLMPVMDGFQFCKEVKQDEKLKNIPFVFYTATYTDKKDEEFALSLGAEKYIVKPVEPEEILNLMQQIIEKYKKGDFAKPKKVTGAEQEVFKRYSERLVNKLEKKMLDLEKEISQRKQVQAELEENEKHFQKAEQVAHLGSWEMDMATGKSKWSDEFFRICGLNPGTIEPSSEVGFKIIHPDDRQKAANAVEVSIKKGIPYNIEKRIVRPDGEIRWVHSIGEFIYDNQHKPNKLIGSFLDITERKHSEQKIAQQADDLSLINQLNKAANRGDSLAKIIELICKGTKKLFDCFGASLFILDNKKEHLILQNLSIPVSLRKTIKKLIGIKIPDVIIPLNKSKFYNNILIDKQPKIINDEKLIRQAIEDTALTRIITNESSIKIINKSIRAIQKLLQIKSMIIIPLYLNEATIGLIDISGKKYFSETDLQRFFTMASQFTGIIQRKQIEENLQVSEARFRSLSEAAFEAIFISENGICLEQNLTAEKMFGYSSAEAIGRLGTEWLVPKDRDMVMKNILSGYEGPYEAKALRKDGTTFPAEIHAKMAHYKGCNVRITALRDITERKQAEEKLKQLSAMVEQSTEGMAQADIEGNLLFVNKAWCEMHGYKNSKSLLSKNLTIFHNKEQIENDIIPFNEKVKKNGAYSGEVGHITKEGKIFPTLMTTTLLKDAKGNPIALAGIAKDITERKLIEYELRKQKEFSEKIINTSNAIVIGLDKNHKIQLFNEGAEKITGYKSANVLGKDWFKLFFPLEIIDEMNKVWKDAWGKKYHTYINTILIKNNDKKVISWQTTGMYDETDNKKHMMLSIGEDITERKRVEEVLKESEEKHRLFFENSPIGIIHYNSNGIITEVNDSMIDIFGSTREKLIGLDINDIPDKKFSKEVFKSLDGEMGHYEDEYTSYTGKKKAIIKANWIPIIREGEVISGVGIIENISDEKQAEEKLRDSEERFRNMFETNHAIMLLIEPTTGKIMDANPTACKYYGYSYKKFINELYIQNINTLSDKEVKNEMQVALKANRNYFIFKHKLSNGMIKDVEVYSSKTLIKSKEVLYSIIHDITDRKQAEEELKKSRMLLRELTANIQNAREEERTAIAREIHDELGQVMTAIKMDLSWVEKRIQPEESLIFNKIDSMKNLINHSIQNVKRISSYLRPGILDDLGLVATLEWQVKDFVSHTDIITNLKIDPKNIEVNKILSTSIFRIIQETLTNITRHSNATKVDIAFKQKNEAIELIIKDNGKGISQKQKKGTDSFGLQGIRERVEYFNGTFNLKSNKNEGTELIINIPFSDEEK